MFRTIDAFLNRFTMYRVVLYGLIIILVVSGILSATGSLFIPVGGLLITLIILVVVTYLSNRLLGSLLHVPTNTESWLITALILTCILPQTSTVARAGAVAFAGLLAIVCKFILVRRGNTLFNPAAVAAAIVGFLGILPATWWIGSPPMAPVTAIVGLLILRKIRRFKLFASFLIAALLMMFLVSGILQGQAASSVLSNAFLSWPLIFLGTIMLTEPSTLPASNIDRLLYGALVGSVFASQLHTEHLAATPQVALLTGNVFTALVSRRVSTLVTLKRRRQVATTAYELEFAVPAGSGLRFQPGQYLEWTLPHAHSDSRGNRRTFSIASAPTEASLRIAIKQNQPSSSYKAALLAMEPGQTIRVSALNGNFVLPSNLSQKLVFIAGGIGVTPFRSMIQYLVDTGQHVDARLIYQGTKSDEFIFKDVFEAARAIGLTTSYHTSRLQSDEVQQLVAATSEAIYYVSGPDPMVDAYAAQLHQHGVPTHLIRTDHFSGY